MKQLTLLDEHTQADNGPVVCLGMTFENDEARREYFQNELRKKLPVLKEIEGFPIGEDEDIIALSDPPYYTACPNPWINEFIKEWEREKIEKYDRDVNEEYHREPFAADVSVGKSGAIYNAHSYHTKVPHKAIMKYILHYTNPGDIVIDVFSGTGMTGVAGGFSGSEKEVASIISKDNLNEVSVGDRKVILNDLSPTAALISQNYNSKINVKEFIMEANKLKSYIDEECSWLFKTAHVIGSEQIEANINYVVWSDNFICPNCSEELNFWNVAVDKHQKKVRDTFECLNCRSQLSKRGLERAWLTDFDKRLGKTITECSRTPVLINYTYQNQRFDKIPDEFDLNLIKEIEKKDIPYWYPIDRMVQGDESRRNDKYGMEYVHQFYSKRNLWAMSFISSKINGLKYKSLFLGILRSSTSYSTRMVKVNISRLLTNGGLFSFGAVTGTLYVPSISGERPVTNAFLSKLDSVTKILRDWESTVITNQSATNLKNIESNTADYIFIDPPFGSNLMYSELNFIWESWLKIHTNTTNEAIMNTTQLKNITEYKLLMLESFKELYRILKPGHWMTVEFSNSQASVWNAIQEAIQQAGFIIANVAALDKKQGSFKAVTTTTAVKQDLVISAYKPKKENVEKMEREQNTEESAWTFITQHLEHLPVFIGERGEAQIISERTPRILFDRMVAYHVQNSLPVPISSAEFQTGVAQRFPMRDGMAFLENQVAEYDKKRTLVKEFAQMSLFVSDENSAIEWIRQQLLKKPQTRQDLHPNYMKEIQHIAKHELLPELDDLLHQNFLSYEGDEGVPDQVSSYLRRNYKDLRGFDSNDPAFIEKAMNRWYVPDPNKQADLEKLREKALLREFNGYVEELESSKKKLKQFRTEAIRAGFKKAYSEKEFEQIVKVGDCLPEKIIQEDDKLLMYYDNACIRLGL